MYRFIYVHSPDPTSPPTSNQLKSGGRNPPTSNQLKSGGRNPPNSLNCEVVEEALQTPIYSRAIEEADEEAKGEGRRMNCGRRCGRGEESSEDERRGRAFLA
ncbi:hypothetical protein QQ045_020054 [Rhodiola kirilowii]